MMTWEQTAASSSADQYERTKQHLMQAAIAAGRLTSEEKEQLAKEMLGAESVVRLLRFFQQKGI